MGTALFNNRPITLIGPMPPPSGGMANQTRQLARLFNDSGVFVEIVQVNRPYYPAWISRFPMVRAFFRLVPYFIQLWKAANKSCLFHIMANSGWSWFLFAAPAVWIGWLHNIPVIVNYRGGEAEAFFNRAWRWVKITVAKASLIVVPSEFLKAVFERRGVPIRIIPNIIDLEIFYPNRQNGFDFNRKKKRLLVARNLEPIYDIATALKAFSLLKKDAPDTILTVAGSGPLRVDLERMADNLGITESVVFTGRLDNIQMAEIYRNTDLLLNTSLADNMPISLLEALACGVPIVSTNVGGIPYLVEDSRTALLIKPGDAEAMATAASQILNDPDLAARLRANGLKEVKNYSWPIVKDMWLAIYNEMLRIKLRQGSEFYE